MILEFLLACVTSFLIWRIFAIGFFSDLLSAFWILLFAFFCCFWLWNLPFRFAATFLIFLALALFDSVLYKSPVIFLFVILALVSGIALSTSERLPKFYAAFPGCPVYERSFTF